MCGNHDSPGRGRHSIKPCPLLSLLQDFCPPTRQAFRDGRQLYYTPVKVNDIRWNWEKFLITRSGKPFMRYDPNTRPQDIRNDIMFLLQQET